VRCAAAGCTRFDRSEAPLRICEQRQRGAGLPSPEQHSPEEDERRRQVVVGVGVHRLAGRLRALVQPLRRRQRFADAAGGEELLDAHGFGPELCLAPGRLAERAAPRPRAPRARPTRAPRGWPLGVNGRA